MTFNAASLVVLLSAVGAEPVAPLLRFSDVPGVTVTYYDVAGRNIAEIHKSVAKHAPKDPATKRILPATSNWTLAVKVNSLTTGGRCAVVGASLDFRGAATMPRLVDDPDRPAPVSAAWENYRAQLEARQAAQLHFARKGMSDVERAILASRCDRAEAAADAAIAKLQEGQRNTFGEDSKNLPKLKEPEPS